ncbi:MAG: hypothetical protein O7B35_12645 [Deltaproteobacteria bacterium]|nr:hypothetical protein [Deltaproteobacteria bacterium]
MIPPWVFLHDFKAAANRGRYYTQVHLAFSTGMLCDIAVSTGTHLLHINAGLRELGTSL